MSELQEILKAIDAYAGAYAQLQKWQEQSHWIPRGDQKTGCIGEFYTYLYLRSKYPGAAITYGSTVNKGWDIAVELPDRKLHIQTKTVSAYSQTRRLSPIHPGWDELYVVYLSLDFQPIGFWMITDTTFVSTLVPRKGVSGPKMQVIQLDHPLFGRNRIEEFKRLIAVQLESV